MASALASAFDHHIGHVDVPLSTEAIAFAAESSAANTRRAYRADWSDFVDWCVEHGRDALPAVPASVADYLADRATDREGRPALAVATLQRRLVAIARAHQLAGHESPTSSEGVRAVLKGIRRQKSVAQRRVAPLTVPVLRQVLVHLPDSLLGVRDRALLLLGFAGALRRSELVELDVADLQEVDEGLVLRLRRSKTDQEGAGTIKGIPLGEHAATCPVRAVAAWLKLSGVQEGPLFCPIDRHGTLRRKRLNGGDVAAIIKRSVAAAGFDPDRYSGHSLRAGLATAAAKAGASSFEIRRQTGHKSDRMLERYIRDGSLFDTNPAGRVGL